MKNLLKVLLLCIIISAQNNFGSGDQGEKQTTNTYMKQTSIIAAISFASSIGSLILIRNKGLYSNSILNKLKKKSEFTFFLSSMITSASSGYLLKLLNKNNTLSNIPTSFLGIIIMFIHPTIYCTTTTHNHIETLLWANPLATLSGYLVGYKI